MCYLSPTQNSSRKPSIFPPPLGFNDPPATPEMACTSNTKIHCEGGKFSEEWGLLKVFFLKVPPFFFLGGGSKKQNSPTENVTCLVFFFIFFPLNVDGRCFFSFELLGSSFWEARFLRQDKVCLGPVVKVGCWVGMVRMLCCQHLLV